MGSEQNSDTTRILKSNLTRLTEVKEAPDLSNLQDEIARLTAENGNLTAIIEEYKKKVEIGTSEVIQLNVNLHKLEQKHDSAMVLAKQKQDDLEGQLRSVHQVNEVLTDNVRALEEKNGADEGLRLQLLWKREEFEAKFKKFVDSTKRFMDVNVRLTSCVSVGVPTAVALDAPMEDGHGHDQQELDDGPSTSTAAVAMAGQARKRKDNNLVGKPGNSKKRREADNETIWYTEDDNDSDSAEIVVKIEGVEVERDDDRTPLENIESEADRVDLSTKVFGNDKIMSNIIKYLPIKELLTLRLTCKTWNNASIKRLFKNFHISDISFTDDCISNLFETCGKYITHLKISLEDQNVFTLNDLRNLIFNLAPALVDLTLVDNRSTSTGSEMWTWTQRFVGKNQTSLKPLALKRLTLKPTFDTDLCRLGFIQFLTKLFNAATKLEHIDIAKGQHCQWNYWKNMNLGILQAIEKLPSLENLNSLILREIYKDELELLIRLSARKENSLKLTAFDTACISRTYKCHGNYDIGERLETFLKLQAKSLKRLTIGHDYEKQIGVKRGGAELAIQLPKLDKLKQLSLYLDESLEFLISRERECIKLQSLAKNCPNLKTFEFVIEDAGNMEHSEWMKYIPHAEPHFGVQVLRATIDHHWSDNKLKRLAALFPNVRQLSVWLDRVAQLDHIWDKWSNLETLHISFRCVGKREFVKLDKYLTGLPEEEHGPFLLKVASGLNLAELDLTNLRTKLGLANLKNLCDLTLDFTGSNLVTNTSESKVRIGDITVYFGFAPLRKLRTLKILPAQLISPVCRAVLSKVLES